MNTVEPLLDIVDRDSEVQHLLADLLRADTAATEPSLPLSPEGRGENGWLSPWRDWSMAMGELLDVLNGKRTHPPQQSAEGLVQPDCAAARALMLQGDWRGACARLEPVTAADHAGLDPLSRGLFYLVRLQPAVALPSLQTAWAQISALSDAGETSGVSRLQALHALVLGLVSLRHWSEVLGLLEREFPGGVSTCLGRASLNEQATTGVPEGMELYRRLHLATIWEWACGENGNIKLAQQVHGELEAALRRRTVDALSAPAIRILFALREAWMLGGRRDFKAALERATFALELLGDEPADSEAGGRLGLAKLAHSLRATCLNRLGRWREAEQEHLRALRISERLWKRYPRTTLRDIATCHNNYGLFLMQQQRTAEGLEHLRGVPQRLRAMREEAPQQLDFFPTALLNLSEAQVKANDFHSASATGEEAEAALRDLYAAEPERYRARYGTLLSNLCTLYLKTGELEKAEASGKQAVELLREAAASDAQAHEATLAKALNNLGMVYKKTGKLEVAHEAIASAVTMERADHGAAAGTANGAETGTLAAKLNNLAQMRAKLGQDSAAEAAYEESLALYRSAMQENPEKYRSEFALLLNNYGAFLNKQGLHKSATAMLDEGLQLLRLQVVPAKPNKANQASMVPLLVNLAAVRGAQQRPREAVKVLSEAVALLRDLLPDNRTGYGDQLATALGNLSQLHRRLKQPVLAEQLWQEGLELRRSLPPTAANRQQLALQYRNHGYLCLRSKHWKAAEASFLAALPLDRELYSTSIAAYAAGLANTLEGLSRVYLAAARLSEARESLLELLRIRRESAATGAVLNLIRLRQTLEIAVSIYQRSRDPRGASDAREEHFRVSLRLMRRHPAARAAARAAWFSGLRLGVWRLRCGMWSSGMKTLVAITAFYLKHRTKPRRPPSSRSDATEKNQR